MLPFDFDYYRPETIEEALEIFQSLDEEGRQPIFFSGGTELITLGRIGLAYAEAVIDIKNISEFRKIEMNENQLILGSALTLREVADSNLFPLLRMTVREIADHTARVKITLGGNICAQIFYREAVLPFLLADSKVMIAGKDGVKTTGINEIFQQQLRLKKGEVLLQLSTDRTAIDAPFINIKRRQQWKTGYPLITIASLKMNNKLRVAISGLCPFPFRSREMEEILNNSLFPFEERIEKALDILPGPVLDDVEGSSDFRIFALRNLLYDVWAALGGR